MALLTLLLKKDFTIKDLGKLKWFLGMYIFRDYSKQSLWLLQDSYIEKVANKFILDLDPLRCLHTLMAKEELLLLPTNKEVIDTNKILY